MDTFAGIPISSQPPPQPVAPLDPYKVLGIRPGASEEALKAAYKKRSQETHPDHASGSQEAFQLVGAAYEEVKRRLHQERWGTSSGSYGSGVQQPLKQITWAP